MLKNPPRPMPDEAAISPTFGRKYGVLEQVFDWTHILHAQTVDVLASKDMTAAEKDREIEALWRYYFESVPYHHAAPDEHGVSGQPAIQQAFRQKIPR